MKIQAALIALVFPLVSHAGLQLRTLEFTAAEKAQHKAGLPTLVATTANCLYDVEKFHSDFFKQNRFSPFYGDLQKSFIQLNPDQRVDYIARNIQVSNSQVRSAISTIRNSPMGTVDGKISNMSCVGLVMRCLGEGFKAAKQDNIWAKVKAYTVAADLDGTALQVALRGLGWRNYYWNPDVSQNAAWDKAETSSSNAFKGYHASRYAQVLKSGGYYTTPVDDAKAMINFGSKTPAVLKAAPLFVATAHTGYHVFAGYQGYVVEGHAGRGALAFDIVEAGAFNPMIAAGKPSGANYRSGLISLPPQF